MPDPVVAVTFIVVTLGDERPEGAVATGAGVALGLSPSQLRTIDNAELGIYCGCLDEDDVDWFGIEKVTDVATVWLLAVVAVEVCAGAVGTADLDPPPEQPAIRTAAAMGAPARPWKMVSLRIVLLYLSYWIVKGDGETVVVLTVTVSVALVPPKLDENVMVQGPLLNAAMVKFAEPVDAAAWLEGVTAATFAQLLPSVAVKVVVVPVPLCEMVAGAVEPSEVRTWVPVGLPSTKTASPALGEVMALVDGAVDGDDDIAVVGATVGVAVALTVGIDELLQAFIATANATRASHGLNFFMHPHTGSG